jgi:hypothetical protein
MLMASDNIQIKWYKVVARKGDTFKSLCETMFENSPEPNFAGACVWTVSRKGKCYVMSGSIVLPKLYGDVSKPIKRRWILFMRTLTCHEMGHVKFGRLCRDLLNRCVTSPKCDAIGGQKQIFDHVRGLENQYEKTTNHGMRKVGCNVINHKAC